MSIAEKLTTVAENTPKVYDAGYKNAVEGTCREFSEKGIAVRCEPVANYPVEIVSELTPSVDGHTSVTLTVLGKNLLTFTKMYEKSYVYRSTGGCSDNSTTFATNYIPCSHLQGQTVTLNHSTSVVQITSTNMGVAFYTDIDTYDGKYNNGKATHISGTNVTTFTVPENANYMRFTIYYAYENETQLELGHAITAFEPYTEKKYTVDFGKTVYGGSFNWLTGKLTQTHRHIDPGGLEWEFSEDNECFYADLPDAVEGTALWHLFTHARGEYDNMREGGYSGADNVFDICDSSIAVICWSCTSVEDFLAYLADNASDLTYPIAEPYTEQINNAPQIVVNSGANTIHSSTGDTTVRCRESAYTEYDRFWDNNQQGGHRTDYTHAYPYTGWTDANFKPKYDIVPNKCRNMFVQNKNITDLKGLLEKQGVVLDTSNSTDVGYMFYESSITHIPTIDASSATATLDRTFYSGSIITIDKVIVPGTMKFSSFMIAQNLEHVIFEGVIGQNGLKVDQCTKLDHDSLMSIINCLADYSEDTSGTQWVVTLGTTNLNKLTNSEKAIATQKGWTLA